MNKIYKVYKYTSPSNKIYIGQTCNTLKIRAANGDGYKECPKFYQAILKYGWNNFIGEILKDNLTAEQANYWETYYIQKYNSINDKYGYNISLGGSNSSVSQETREKMRQSHIGKKHSNETKQKISCALSHRTLSEEHKKNLSKSRLGKKGRTFTTEQKEKIKQTMLNNPSVSKKVKCIETGIIYQSAAEAVRQLGLKSNHINDCINNPTRYKTCGGYHWERITEE